MIYIMTKAGHGKSVSEDTVLVGNQIFTDTSDTVDIPDSGFVCVADGVGGSNAGEVASSFVLNELSNLEWSDEETVKNQLLSINQKLIEESKTDAALSGMATTLSGICIQDENMKIIHVGNTRVYAMQGRFLKQITSDHTTYNWLKSLGRTEEAEACNKSEITNCFGGDNEKLISKLQVTSSNTANTVLLTSDGIHEYVSIDELEDILSSDVPNDEKCNAICNAALGAGSNDDMTVVLVCLQEE